MEELAVSLHEVGREAVESGLTVNPTGGRFLALVAGEKQNYLQWAGFGLMIVGVLVRALAKP